MAGEESTGTAAEGDVVKAGESSKSSLKFSDMKIVKGDAHRAIYTNHSLCVTSNEDVRLVFFRVAAHTPQDSVIYQEVDLYMSPTQAMHLHQMLGRQILDWKRTAEQDLAALAAYDPFQAPEPRDSGQ